MAHAPRKCATCGKAFTPRWLYRTRPTHGRFCSQTCSNRWTASHRATSTGRTVTTKGYVMLYRPDHPRAKGDGYVMEHRLVMEAAMGRLLRKNEVVHHIDGKRSNNSPDNLVVMTKRKHDRHTNNGRRHFVICPRCQHQFLGRKNVRYVTAR